MLGAYLSRQWWMTGAFLCGVLGGSVCASAQAATVSRYEYSTTITNGGIVPREVSLALDSARENLASARVALDVREYARAQRLAEQAEADARMLEVQADTESLRRIARDLRLSSQAVRDEAVSATTVAYTPPSPPSDLRMAQDELASARIALNAGEYARARELSENAWAHASLAEMRSSIDSIRDTARDVRVSSETVRDSAVRASNMVYLPPSHPVELQSAREKLESARIALDTREYNRATRLAELAREDARVAEIRAGTDSSRQVARYVRLSSESVRDEAMRLAALY